MATRLELSVSIFRQTNNDIDAAFVALEDDIATLVFVMTNEEVTPEKVSFVAGNGFNDEEARKALEKSKGDVEKAIARLSGAKVTAVT